MKRPIVGSAVFALSAIAVVLACRVGEVAVADSAAPKAPSATASNTLVPMGTWGKCTDAEWKLPDEKNNQTVNIHVDLTKTPPIQTPDPKCAKESFKGKLTFKVGPLPKDYHIEIDILTRKDQGGKQHKGPFLRNGAKGMFPQTGRCVLASNQSCTFEKHDRFVETNEVFPYNIYLWDALDELGEINPLARNILAIERPTTQRFMEFTRRNWVFLLFRPRRNSDHRRRSGK